MQWTIADVPSKNTRVKIDPERVHWGQTPSGSRMTRKSVSFPQTWQIMGSYWPSSGSYSASGWLISGSSLTRNGVWPQWTLSGSKYDPGVFRVSYSPSVWTRARNEASVWAILMQILRKIQLLSCGRVKQSSFWMASHAQGLTPGYYILPPPMKPTRWMSTPTIWSTVMHRYTNNAH